MRIGHGCDHGRNFLYQIDDSSNSHKRKASWNHKKWNNTKVKQENGKYIQNIPSNAHENNYRRCGMKGHWSRTYRTSKHSADLYQASIKEKGKEIERNFTNRNRLDLTYYDSDFFEGPSEKIDYLLSDENIATE